MGETSIVEAIVKRDRLVVIAGIVILLVLAWLYILLGAGMGHPALEMSSPTTSESEPPSTDMSMDDMEGMDMEGMDMEGMDMDDMAMDETDMEQVPAMMQVAVWTPSYAGMMFSMWWVMMIAMMIPSAAPMILLFATVNRKQRSQGAPFVPTSIFVAGYLVVWAGFSLIAVLAQWGLERAGILSFMMASTNGLFASFVLILAGIYQLTPLKHACLSQCRSPLQFVTRHWRKGADGAFRMGIDHGAICVGCCWALMALLFVGGVMNLYWIVLLAVLVLLEKTIPAGHTVSTITGIGLILWGGWMLFTTL